MKDIYVEKYYGKKLSTITASYDIKNHSLIYHYVNAVEQEMGENIELEKEITQKKYEYKHNIHTD